MTLVVSRTCRHRHAFTLLELMIALAILMLVVGLLYAAGNAVTASWSRLTEEQRLFEETMRLDRVLDSALTNAIPFVWRDEEGEDYPFFFGQPGRVRLAYRHRLGSPEEGTLRFMELFVDEGTLVAHYQGRPYLNEGPSPERVLTSVLARDVESVEFQYADWHPEDGLIWSTWWDPLEWTPVRKELPLAVIVNVHWRDGRREAWIRRTAGSGQFERYGMWHSRRLE